MICAYCKCSNDTKAASNSSPSVILSLSEHEASVLAMILVTSANREGMHGNYHTARLLNAIRDQFPEKRIGPRGLGPESISQVIAAQDVGWKLTYLLTEVKPEVLIVGTSLEGKEVVLGKCSIPRDEAGKDVLEAVRDFFDRRPLKLDRENEPESP